MSHATFRSIRRSVLIASMTFVVVSLSSMISTRAHQEATCCLDPCTTSTGGVSCGCHPICNTSYLTQTIYYSHYCNPIESMDNCARGNCFMYDLYDEKNVCNIQCCSDDFSECI